MFILTRAYIKNCQIVLYLKAETLTRLIVHVLIFYDFQNNLHTKTKLSWQSMKFTKVARKMNSVSV